MRKKFFLKNLLMFLFPVLIPTLILGTLSIFFTRQYVQGEINKNNANLFNQIDRSIELIFTEMDSLQIGLSNPEELYRMEEILRTQTLTLDNLRLMQTTQNFINAPVNARPYIESIYVYVKNEYDQFLVSGYGITGLKPFYDTAWMQSFLNNEEQTKVWTESRSIQRYSFEKPVPVMTVYKNVFSTVQNRSVGVIVLNIYSDYVNKLLSNSGAYPGQQILVVDDRREVVFRNASLEANMDLSLDSPIGANGFYSLEVNGDTYWVTESKPNKFGWRYITAVPEKSLNQIPFKLSTITLSLVCLSFLLGLALAYYLTRRNVHHIRQMIFIIQSAENGKPLPAFPPSQGFDEYDYIIQKIIKNFIEQHYLQIQLSEKKYRLAAAEMLALQSQMNPHFLFNTLETIYWKVMALTGKPNEVNRMLESLSELLRYSLDKPGRVVPLDQEIASTNHYIEIQKIRYSDKFNVIWDYDPEEATELSVVKLLIQPLIENSIYHGIKVKERPSLIKIKMVRGSSHLRITVIDNGIGMSKERLREVRRMIVMEPDTGEHIGLANTSKRIRLSYNTEKGLIIRSKAGLGTAVSLCIPVNGHANQPHA